jgi:hypothetical protein
MQFECNIEGENVIIKKDILRYMVVSRDKEKQISHLKGFDELQDKINKFWEQIKLHI